MNDNNMKKAGFIKKYWNILLIFFGIAVVAASLSACTPSTKTGTLGNETTTTTAQNYETTIATAQNYEKIEVSQEAAARAKAARERFNNQERPIQPIEASIGGVTFKIVPGPDPDRPDNSFRVMEDDYTVYSNNSQVPRNRLYAAVAKDIITASTTIKWRDIFEEREGHNGSYLSIDNHKWLDAIESCDFGFEALLGLAGVKGFEDVKWEDYCHPGIPKTPIWEPQKKAHDY